MSAERPPVSRKGQLLAAGFVPDDALAALETRYTLHRYYEAEDPHAMLRQVSDEVLCIVGTSHASITAELIRALPMLEQISIYGTGYEKIDVAAARARGVVVTNTPDVMTEDVADLALALLLAVTRRVIEADAWVRAGRCADGHMPFSHTVRGQKLGIVGLGKIGSAVARRAECFGIEVVYHNRRPRSGVAYRYYDNLLAMAHDVDILMLTAPGGAQTQHLVDDGVLAALGPQGTLINMARGSLVDETALVQALQSGTLGAAALDVFADLSHPPEALYALPNVVLSQHRGSATFETRGAMAALMVRNVDALFAGQPVLTPVR